MMRGEVQFEGAFDEGNARVSCSESSTSNKKVTSGVIWKVRGTTALPMGKYAAFQHVVIVMKVSCSQYMAFVRKIFYFSVFFYVKKTFYFSVIGYCKS